MSDPTVIPGTPAVPHGESKLPSYIGMLMVVLAFILFAAILFVPKPTSTTDAEIQQVLTILASLVGAFVAWQFGSSISSQKKDAVIATLTPPSTPPVPKGP